MTATVTTPDPRAETGYRLRVYTNQDDWAGLADAWRDLESRDSRARVFQTFTWLSHLWRLDQGAGTQLRLAAVHQPDGRLAALAPMMIQRRLGPVGVRVMRFVGQGQSDFQDILLADDCDWGTALAQIARWLDAVRTDCDRVDLINLPEGSHLLEHRDELFPSTPGWSRDDREDDVVRWVPGGDGFAGFESGLGKRTRKNLRNQWRRVIELDGASVKTLTSSREADTAITDLMTLHQARQHNRGQRGLFRSRARVEVFTTLFKEMLDRGTLRLITLHALGECQTVVTLLHFNATSIAYTLGWRECPQMKRYSLGRLFLYKAAEYGLDDLAAGEFNLGVGGEDYKAWFTKRTRPIHRLTRRRHGLRSRLYDLHERMLAFAYHNALIQRLYFALRPR